jgi:DNA-binding PadR family transcriptional regulator
MSGSHQAPNASNRLEAIEMPRRTSPGDLPTLTATQWLVLALLIEKPSYGYETAARYFQRFGSFLPASRTLIYNALDRLYEAGLVTPRQPALPPPNGARRKTMRVTYAPTPEATGAHQDWLTAPIKTDRWRQEMLARVGSAHLHGPALTRQTLDRYAHHAQLHQQRIQQLAEQQTAGRQQDLRAVMRNQLLAEQHAATTAHIAWANAARHAVQQHPDDD